MTCAVLALVFAGLLVWGFPGAGGRHSSPVSGLGWAAGSSMGGVASPGGSAGPGTAGGATLDNPRGSGSLSNRTGAKEATFSHPSGQEHSGSGGGPASGGSGPGSPQGGGEPPGNGGGSPGGGSGNGGNPNYPWIQVEHVDVSATPCTYNSTTDSSSCTFTVSMYTNSSAGTITWWVDVRVWTGCTTSSTDSGTQVTQAKGGVSPVVVSYTFTFAGEVDSDADPATTSSAEAVANAAGNVYPVTATTNFGGSGSCAP